MTTRLTLLLTLIVLTVNISFAQVTFQKTYGGINYDAAYDVEQITDGGYIITGTTHSFGIDSTAIYLIKTDSIGDTLWTRTFRGTNNNYSNSVQQTVDGGFIIGGSTNSFSTGGNDDVYLIKTNATGDSIWTKAYGGVFSEGGSCVQQTADNGYIIVGSTNSFGAGSYDVYLIKTDAIGDTLWSKTFGGAANDIGYSVQQTTDGGYIITGYTWSYGVGNNNVYLIKTDSTGTLSWSKTFGGANYDQGYSVKQTADGGYIIAGTTRSFGAGNSNIYLIKTDTYGLLLWSRTFGGTNYDQAWFVQQTTDGGYIISGTTESFGAGPNDAYLIKTDANGDTLWTKTIGGASDEQGLSVKQTPDGGYIMAGTTSYSFGFGTDVYLVKTDNSGNSGCNQTNPATIVTIPATIVTSPVSIVSYSATIVTTPTAIVGNGGVITTQCITLGISETERNQSGVSISPNPFFNELKINGTDESGELFLYDITGKEIKRQKALSGKTTLNTATFLSGFYILHYVEGNRIENIKLTKM
jgi:hypothetical protein